MTHRYHHYRNFTARNRRDKVRQKLLTHQRHEYYGFTHKKSTIHRILALLVVTERVRILTDVKNSLDEGVWHYRRSYK